MPDFTIGGNDDLNAQDLFHEELMTQAVAPQNAQQSLLMMAANNSNVNVAMMQQSLLDPSNVEYVVGQDGDIGNMGVNPLLNNSMGFAIGDNQRILNNLALEQENNAELHRGGIYKRGAMNLGAMNQVISKLENADFESLTTFFDTKKHGNWAGICIKIYYAFLIYYFVQCRSRSMVSSKISINDQTDTKTKQVAFTIQVCIRSECNQITKTKTKESISKI